MKEKSKVKGTAQSMVITDRAPKLDRMGPYPVLPLLSYEIHESYLTS